MEKKPNPPGSLGVKRGKKKRKCLLYSGDVRGHQPIKKKNAKEQKKSEELGNARKPGERKNVHCCGGKKGPPKEVKKKKKPRKDKTQKYTEQRPRKGIYNENTEIRKRKKKPNGAVGVPCQGGLSESREFPLGEGKNWEKRGRSQKEKRNIRRENVGGGVTFRERRDWFFFGGQFKGVLKKPRKSAAAEGGETRYSISRGEEYLDRGVPLQPEEKKGKNTS